MNDSNLAPQPGNANGRFGGSAYEAIQNYATKTNTVQLGPAADVSQALDAALTSRTGGRFRMSGSISGTCTAADVITGTIEANIAGGGFVALATFLTNGAGEGARWGCSFNVLTPAVPIGSTITAQVRAVDPTNATATVAIGQATVNLQELPA